MKSPPFRLCSLAVALLLAFAGLSVQAAAAPGAGGKLRLLIVTGGHDFETNQFFQMFKENPEVTFNAVGHPEADEWLKSEHAPMYDVIVFYDMWQNISEEAKADLVSRLKAGKGLVALHHCLGSYQKWDEYAAIIGGKYHLEKWQDNGTDKPASIYKHDVDFRVKVADPNHPVTRGLKDFDIHDETYGLFEVSPKAHALLTTDEPTSSRVIAWTKEYAAARVVYLQLGHDHVAYENPNYRRLLAQAIRWAARK